MSQIVVFGSKHWPACEPTKEYLSEKNVEFTYIDISDSIKNLKMFLKYRDNYSEFEKIKKSGSVGIPCIVVDEAREIIFDHKKLDI